MANNNESSDNSSKIIGIILSFIIVYAGAYILYAIFFVLTIMFYGLFSLITQNGNDFEDVIAVAQSVANISKVVYWVMLGIAIITFVIFAIVVATKN